MSGHSCQRIKAVAGVIAMNILTAPASVQAADTPRALVAPLSASDPPAIAPWEISITPYGWMTSLKGNQTIRGRSSHIDASFIEIAKGSDMLVALMGNIEARNGRWALYSDLVWTKVGIGNDAIRLRSSAPGVTTTTGEALRLNIEMAVLEAGAAYEFIQTGPWSFDIYGGARYWRQKGDMSYEASVTTDIGELERVGTRARARSGSVQWLDPLAGARIRYALAAGQELFLRSDIGGFGVGSKFSWQGLGGYGFNMGSYKGMSFSGLVGYRAL